MTQMKHIGSPSLGRALTRFSVAAIVAVTAASCSVFDTDVTNPNAVSEEALEGPSSAPPLVNGLHAAATRALTGIYGPYSVGSDELTWVGSREHWGWLDAGDVSYPINEYIDGAFPFVSEARWLSNYTIDKLEGFDKENTLRDRAGLVRSYIYGAVVYITIGDMFDDFVVASDRTAPAPPVGVDNMAVMYDSAVAFLDRALPIAQALSNNTLRLQVLALRARAKHAKAVWALLKPARATPASPYVNNAGANADAAAALVLMSGNYAFKLLPVTGGAATISMASEMNSRQEIRAGDVYVNPDPARPTTVAAGAAGIKLRDPVTNQPDPVLLKAIDECCRVASTTLTPFTIVSAREMHLILAEAALATNNTTEFTTRINAMRALEALPPWGGATPAARDMLIYSRQVNLYLQGRRLHDMYRFGIKDAKWLPSNIASKKACFFPIPAIERRTNPEVNEVAEARPTYCS